jgi:hypothetical protein
MHAWHVIRASEIKTMYVVKGDDRVVRRARLQKASRTCMGWGGRGGCLLAWPCMHRQREQGLVVWPTVADEVVRRGAGAGAGLLWSTGTWVVVTMLKCVRALRFRFGSMCVKRKRSTNNHSPKDACLFTSHLHHTKLESTTSSTARVTFTSENYVIFIFNCTRASY